MRKLIFEKWVNPIDCDEKEVIDKEEYFESQEEEGELVEEFDNESLLNSAPHILTQFGFIPVKMYNHPSRQFSYFIGHTNFYITHSVKKTIVDCPGVESFDVFSPYRFRISVAKAFDERSVLHQIEYSLVGKFNAVVEDKKITVVNADLNQKMERAKIEIGASPYWLMFVLPNSELTYFFGEDEKEFEKKKECFLKVHEVAGGVLFTSDGEHR